MGMKFIIIPMGLLLIIALVGDVALAGAVIAGFLGGLAVGAIVFGK